MASTKTVPIRRAGLICLVAAAALILGFSVKPLYAVSEAPAEQICPTCPDTYETRATGVFCPTAATITLTSLMVGLSLAGHRKRNWNA